MGRKMLPSNLKIIAGTERPSRVNHDEPRPEVKIPTPPSVLDKEGKKEWRRVARQLFALGILTDIDRAALAAYCNQYSVWYKAMRALRAMAVNDQLTDGLMIRTAGGNAIQNPLLGIANKASDRMVAYASEFGMTPSSRTRVKAEKALENNDPASKYFG